MQNIKTDYVPKKRKNYNICIICATGIDLLRYFHKNIEIALNFLGHNVKLITDKEWIEKFNNKNDILVESKCDFYLSTNSECYESIVYQQKNTPLLVMCIDRVYHILRNKTNVNNVVHLWVSRRDMNNAYLYIENNEHYFLPHAASIDEDLDINKLFNKKRVLDVFISCHYIKNFASSIYPKGGYDISSIKRVYHSFFNDMKSLEECTEAEMNFDKKQLADFMWDSALFIDSKARMNAKLTIINKIIDAGFSLHCCGANWEKTEIIKNENFIYYGPLTTKVSNKKMEDAKIVVNAMVPSFDGSHERIFESMLRGALCITTPSDYLRETFKDGENIVFFDPLDLNTLVEKINFYLQNEGERLRITKNAFNEVISKHTWYHRADELLDIYENYISLKK